MDEITLLTSLAMFLLLAAVCSFIFNRIKLPPLIGYLIAGIIVANFFEVTETGEDVVEMLSNMGLIMLMFCIGMEINLKKIRKQGVFAMKVALVEIPFMVVGGTLVGTLMGMDPVQSLSLGAVVAGSSTAVVLGVLLVQNRLEKDQIETLILVIIMEDISQVILLSVITPMMAGSELDAGGLIAMIVSILAFMLVSIFAGVKLMPRVINWVSDSVSSEVLVILTVGLAFGMALLASYVGLSVAIGAFLMGMMIASSRKSKEILHDIEPMKNIFMAMFFISVGMEVSLGTLADNILMTVGFMLMFVVMKTLAVFSGYWLGNETSKNSFASAVSFLAMGEFAFIIAKQAYDYNVFSDDVYTSIVGAALLSMIALPFISSGAIKMWDKAYEKLPYRIITSLRRIDSVRSSFYGRINNASKRTRREVSDSITSSYICILMVAVIEVVFLMVAQPIAQWALTYFGGTEYMWNVIILLLNLFALYLPIVKLITNLKNIHEITQSFTNDKPKTGLYSSFLKTNSSLLAIMIGISILIVIPNGLDIWKNLIVLFIALIILLYYNRKNLQKINENESYDVEDEFFNNINMDSFQAMMDKKVFDQEEAKKDRTTVSIDTGDFKY